MEPDQHESCYACNRREDADVHLRRCPMCRKSFCEEHSFRLSGLEFCSRGCGEYFFHGDPDD